jgi:DNA-binding PadR family transcriptional regulator
VLANTGEALAPNVIAAKMGIIHGCDRSTHNGKWLGPAQRIISALTSLRRQELVVLRVRPDGLSGSAYAITEAGRAVLRSRSNQKKEQRR